VLSLDTPIRLNVASGYRAQVTQGLTVNTSENDSDTVISGNNVTNLLYVNAGQDAVIVGNNGQVGIDEGFAVFSDVTNNNYRANVAFVDTSDFDATGPRAGGGLAFGYKYTSSNYAAGPIIKGEKDNTTSGHYGANLQFWTRPNGDHPQERVRILSTGEVGINATQPSAKLHVVDDTTIGSDLNDYRRFSVFQGHTGNVNAIDFITLRTVQDGTDWTSAATRIQHRVDSTEQGYLQFNGPSGYGSVAIGSGSNAGGYHTINENIRFTQTGIYANSLQNDRDFRISGQSKVNQFLVDSGAGTVLIDRVTSVLGGGNGGLFQIGSGSGGAGMTIHSSTTGLGDIQFADGTTGDASYRGMIRYSHTDDAMEFWTGGSVEMRLMSDGKLGVGTTTPDTIIEAKAVHPILTLRTSNTSASNSNATVRLAESGASDTLDQYWDIKFEQDAIRNNLVFNQSTMGETLRFGSSGSVIFNNNGDDKDFRVASDSTSHAIFLDSTTNSLSVLGNIPSGSYRLNVSGSQRIVGNSAQLRLDATNNASGSHMALIDINTNAARGSHIALTDNDGREFGIKRDYSGGSDINRADFYVDDGTTQHSMFRMYASGSTIDFNPNNEDKDFKIHTDDDSNVFVVNGGDDTITMYKAALSDSTVGHDFRSNGQATFVCNNTSRSLQLNNTSGAEHKAIHFQYSGATRGSIDVSTNGTIYLTSSDRRLKDDIEAITDGTEKVMSMKPVTHKWKADPDGDAVHGFIAQDMQEVVPEAVKGEPEGDEMMTMDYGRITPVLVAALQDAHKKIEALEARLTELEAD